jgi:eukaryotic-like serine/threonine-protein kinase
MNATGKGLLDGDQTWRRVSPHLERALELPPAERPALLAALREQDPTVAVELDRLLHEREALSEAGFLAGTAPGPSSTLAGQTLGAYTLLSRIGEGGMGSVWLARRSDGRFDGLAAIKLLDARFVGRPGEERFRREGGILARLRHPHIAHMIDAGLSPQGQPYLVLEYVEGTRFDRHCDGNQLDVEARLRLFLDVLEAVAHAHGNLIVHRDIKPANVMVRKDGEVKLLDFGIAKLLDPEPSDARTLTREGESCLTPGYAAPEQLLRGQISTATDVYGLGVMLYELLTGVHPVAASPQALLWWMTTLYEGPPRMTDVVAPRRAAPSAAQVESAARRGTTPARLRRRLAGDLDTIVGRAMKREPDARYPSVAAFAEDIRHWLAHRPIRARPDTVGYRLGKLVRRHWTAVSLGVLAAAALVAGLAGTLSQARRATRAAAVAETQRQRADDQARAAAEQRDFALQQLWRAEAMNDLDAFLLVDAAPAGRPFTAGELLARAELILQRQGGPADETRVEVLIAIGRLYRRQDDFVKARELLARAYRQAQALPDRALRARAGCALASVVAIAEGDRAEQLLREADADLPRGPQFTPHRIFCLLCGNEVAHDRDDGRLSLARIEEAAALVAASPRPSPELQLTVAMEHAEALRYLGRPREAAVAYQAAYARMRELGRDSTGKTVSLLNNWALCLQAMGRLRASERLFRQALAIDSPDGRLESASPNTLNNLAHTLHQLGRLDQAARLAGHAHAEAVRTGHQRLVANASLLRAVIQRERGDLAGAGRLLGEAEPFIRRNYGERHFRRAVLASELGLQAEARGRLAEAVIAADQAVAIAAANPRGNGGHLARFLRRRALLRLRQGHLEAALADADRSLAQLEATGDPTQRSSELGLTQLARSRVLAAAGRPDAAVTAAAAALPHLEAELGDAHPQTVAARRASSPRPARASARADVH